MENNRKYVHPYLILVLLIFGSIYSISSLVNHYLFRTYALDLGLYTNAAYKFAHLQWGDNLMIKEKYEIIFGGHFDLYLLLFSPLIYLFGTYTLLLVQLVGLLFGGVGVYRFVFLKSEHKTGLALCACICFFLFYGVYSALAFDYHSVVVASSIVPWFMYFVLKRSYRKSLALLLLLLVSQEDVALFVFFICLGLMIQYRKDSRTLKVLGLFALTSISYFFCIIKFVIPFFSKEHTYTGFCFSVLGDSPLEALKNLFFHPFYYFKVLFVNHNSNIEGDYVKVQTHFFVLFSGLYLLFYRPYYLLMLLPIYGQKFYHDNLAMWTFGWQYSVEFAPVLAVGAFSVIAEIQQKRARIVLAAFVLLGTFCSTLRVMDRHSWFINSDNVRFYQSRHYKRDYNTSVVYQQLALIPSTAKVSSQSPFVPHLCLRNFIYQFPIVKDAEYIVYSNKESYYPLDEASFDRDVVILLDSGEWIVQFKNSDFTVLKKKRAY